MKKRINNAKLTSSELFFFRKNGTITDAINSVIKNLISFKSCAKSILYFLNKLKSIINNKIIKIERNKYNNAGLIFGLNFICIIKKRKICENKLKSRILNFGKKKDRI
jgi:hypothetical protein